MKTKMFVMLSVAIAHVACGEFESETPELDRELSDGDGDSFATKGEGLVTASGSVTQGQYAQYSFTKVAGWSYTICIDVSSGDADLYGDFAGPPTTSQFQYRSWNVGLKSDCISFYAAQGGTYYVAVYGFAAGSSSYTYRRSSSDNATIPSYLSAQLRRPNTCTTLTQYGPFNYPWGNPTFTPFYTGYINYIHNGADFACAVGTAVKAVCTGRVKAVGNLGSTMYNNQSYAWGHYVVQECAFGNNTVTIAYDHLNAAGLPATNAMLTAGQTEVGTIFDLSLPGEPDHLHLGVCANSWGNCSGLQGGASQDTAFPPASYLNPNATALWAP